MDDRYILPFKEKPYTQMYHNKAFPMGIIQGNTDTDEIMPWICGKFINCVWIPESRRTKFDHCIYDDWCTDDKILLQQRIDFFPETYEYLGIDILRFLKQMICNGAYVYGMYNEKYIPGKYAYKNVDRSHDFFIYGYDDNDQIFYSAGYLDDGIFHAFKISYTDFEDSIKNILDPKLFFNFYSFNKEAKFELNSERIITDLSDYINSRNSKKHYTSDKYYGLEACKMLKEYLGREFKRDKVPDVGYTKAFVEHKFFMWKRAEYLSEYVFKKPCEYVMTLENVYKMSQIIHNLCRKIIISDKNITSNKEKILSLFDEINESERVVLSNLLSDCKVQVNNNSL